MQEYLRIILHDNDPSKFRSILAMTFTNKAANEMKVRILDKLIQLSKPAIEKTTEDQSALNDMVKALQLTDIQIEERSAKCLNAILHNYGMFSVMTIDKFTHKVIRTFAKDLGLSLDFDVELDIKSLRKSVTDMLFDQIGRNADLTKLMVHYADSNLKDDKSWNFKNQLFEFSKSLFKEDALSAIERLKKFEAKDFIEIRKTIIEEQKKFESKLQKLGTDAMEIIDFHQLSTDDFIGKNSSVAAQFKRISIGEIKLPSPTNVKNVEAGKWPQSDSPNAAIVESISGDLEQFFNQIMAHFEEHEPQYLLNKEILKNLNNLSLMNHILKATEEIKEEENILLISDFYKKIAEIIIEEPVPFIYERLGVRYDHFLLDEFQDTSHLQWINIIPLLHNSLSQKKTNLIVGDGKQAIYRWRNGEVEQFVDLPEKVFNPQGIESLKEAEYTFAEEGLKINLKSNWRSAPEIVNFNNDFFENISKSKPLINRIYEGGRQHPQKSFQGYLEFNIQDGFKENEQHQFILNSIQKSLDTGYSLKDICILVRKNDTGSNIASFLTDNSIKVISQDSLFVGKDIYVKFIVSAFSALSNPKNLNYKMKCIEHYIQVLSSNRSTEIWESINNSTHSIIQFFKTEGFHVARPETFHSFYEYVEQLIEVFKLKLNGNPYLQHLLEQVHLFEKHNSTNIQSFINWFNDKGREESISSPEGAEALQIMTFHKAKGLEFPIVICPFFEWDTVTMKSDKWIEDDTSLMPSYFLKPSAKTRKTKFQDVMEEEDLKQEMDHLNLVYVAFTRPEIALFVSGDSKKTGSPSNIWLKPYLESSSFERTDDIYTIGTFTHVSLKEKSMSESYDLKFLEHYMNRTTFSLKSDQSEPFEIQDVKRKYGTELHYVLAQINDLADLDEALESAVFKGSISKVNYDSIHSEITDLFADDKFKSYFSQAESLNERVIIDEDGRAYIPDKIVVKEAEVLVVDFKTGEEQIEKYRDQVRNYMSLVKGIFKDKSVSGEIYYTSTKQAIEVQFE